MKTIVLVCLTIGVFQLSRGQSIGTDTSTFGTGAAGTFNGFGTAGTAFGTSNAAFRTPGTNTGLGLNSQFSNFATGFTPSNQFSGTGQFQPTGNSFGIPNQFSTIGTPGQFGQTTQNADIGFLTAGSFNTGVPGQNFNGFQQGNAGLFRQPGLLRQQSFNQFGGAQFGMQSGMGMQPGMFGQGPSQFGRLGRTNLNQLGFGSNQQGFRQFGPQQGRFNNGFGRFQQAGFQPRFGNRFGGPFSGPGGFQGSFGPMMPAFDGSRRFGRPMPPAFA